MLGFSSVKRWMRGDNAKGFISTRSTAGSAIEPWTAGKPQWLPHNMRSYDREAYRKAVLIFRCTQYTANAAASAPMRVQVEVEPGEFEARPEHSLRRLIRRPNMAMGEARFWSFITIMMCTAGYVVIEKERDFAGRVIGLWPLRSDWLRPIPRQYSSPDWEYRVPGIVDPFILKSQDVIPITFADVPDPHNYTGIGPVEVALREVGIANVLTDFLKAFLDRGAMPLYVALPSDDPAIQEMWTDQARVDAFREGFAQRFGGLPNALEVAIPVGIKDIKPLGLDFNELAYPQLRNLTDAAICEAFGIPPILVGAQVGLERSTFSNTKESRRSFYEDTMTFFWARLDDALTRHLLPDFEIDPTFSLEFDVSSLPAFKDDDKERWSRATDAFARSVISRHTAQREMGIKPHGPDVFLMSFSMTEVPVGDEPKRAIKSIEAKGRPVSELGPGDERALPPIVEDGVEIPISDQEVEEAIDQFDEEFPDLAGLLDAEVV